MKLSTWHKKVLLAYLVGVFAASIYVPWHAFSQFEGSARHIYLGYGLIWFPPEYEIYGGVPAWRLQIDISTVLLEIVALTAGAGITILVREFWETWPKVNE